MALHSESSGIYSTVARDPADTRAPRATLAAAILLALAALPALSAEEKAKFQVPGLPKALDWTFDFDATFGAFAFGGSLFENPKPDQPSGDLSDNWFEGSITPGVSAEYTLKNSAQIYGKLSGVGERTYSSAPALVGDEASSFDVEDLYIGWRSGTSFDSFGENALDLKVGRAPYQLGHGLLLWDGSAEGGSRGGYWTGARKAFELAAIGQFKPGNSTFEAFYLERDELPEAETNSVLAGVNYEYAIGKETTLGATYMKLTADSGVAPQRDGLNVYNLRAYTVPFARLPAFSFEAEYVKEDNGSALDSIAWNALVGYQFDLGWKPKLSYRYAFFEGDDLSTPENEGFDGLFTGFYDWGTWWQGEIAGEYFLANSNLISHQLRVHTTPSDSLGTGLILYDFVLDNPAAAGPQVSSDNVATELDWYMDWNVNDNVTISLVAAVADPGKAVEQSSGRDDVFYYGMFFFAYSY